MKYKFIFKDKLSCVYIVQLGCMMTNSLSLGSDCVDLALETTRGKTIRNEKE